MRHSIDIEHRRHRFTVDDYHRMVAADILHEDDAVELIDGDVVEMTPIGSQHAGRVARLHRLLVRRLGDRAIVWGRNPVQLGDLSEPQPDLALLLPREDDYTTALPVAEDVLLLIEVADTSLDYDRNTKLALYARHRIPVVLLLNLLDTVVEVYEDPAEGEYQQSHIVSGADRLPVPNSLHRHDHARRHLRLSCASAGGRPH